MTGRGAREVGDGVDTWAQAVSGERKREGATATVASSPDWADPGRKREERKEKEKEGQRVGGEGNGPAGQNEEGRGEK